MLMVSILKLDDVTKVYGKDSNAFTALDSIKLEFKKGTTNALVGKSGSGKSTLLHILIGLDHATKGQVLFDGKNILTDLDTDYWRGNSVGIIFQQFFLQPNDSVLENVALPLKIQGIKKSVRLKQAIKAVEQVGLQEKINNKANDLSGGQKQRVAIARALVGQPSIIIADEPTGNLDTENSLVIEELLFGLNAELGTTLILVTHDEELASKCQRIINLKDGQVINDSLTIKGQK